MALRINDTAPDFVADTTEGRINFHEWIGDGYAVLFSHPKDFTPVCTTELGVMAGMSEEFAKRNAKIIGISVDPVDDHNKWKADIESVSGNTVAYPMIGDSELNVAKLYEMLPAAAGDSSKGRTPADNATVRSVCHHRSRQEDQALIDLSDDHGTEFRRNPARARFNSIDRRLSSRHAGKLEAGRRRNHNASGFKRGRQGAIRRI